MKRAVLLSPQQTLRTLQTGCSQIEGIHLGDHTQGCPISQLAIEIHAVDLSTASRQENPITKHAQPTNENLVQYVRSHLGPNHANTDVHTRKAIRTQFARKGLGKVAERPAARLVSTTKDEIEN